MTQAYRSQVFQAPGTTQILSSIGTGSPPSQGILHSVTLTGTAAATVTVRDGGSSDTIVFAASIAANGVAHAAGLDIQLSKGLTVTITGAGSNTAIVFA